MALTGWFLSMHSVRVITVRGKTNHDGVGVRRGLGSSQYLNHIIYNNIY